MAEPPVPSPTAPPPEGGPYATAPPAARGRHVGGVHPYRRRGRAGGVRRDEGLLRRGREQVQRADQHHQQRLTMPPVAWLDRLRRTDERGVTTIEFVLVAWLFMLMVLGALQFGLWWNAQHVVLGAAQDAARLAAVEDGTPRAGRARALELLQVGLGRDAATATVDVRRDPELARATVTARLHPLLPIGSGIELRASARSFAEHFRPSGAQPPASGATP